MFACAKFIFYNLLLLAGNYCLHAACTFSDLDARELLHIYEHECVCLCGDRTGQENQEIGYNRVT